MKRRPLSMLQTIAVALVFSSVGSAFPSSSWQGSCTNDGVYYGRADTYTDAEGAVGHWSELVAADLRNGRNVAQVLIFRPYRNNGGKQTRVTISPNGRYAVYVRNEAPLNALRDATARRFRAVLVDQRRFEVIAERDNGFFETEALFSSDSRKVLWHHRPNDIDFFDGEILETATGKVIQSVPHVESIVNLSPDFTKIVYRDDRFDPYSYSVQDLTHLNQNTFTFFSILPATRSDSFAYFLSDHLLLLKEGRRVAHANLRTGHVAWSGDLTSSSETRLFPLFGGKLLVDANHGTAVVKLFDGETGIEIVRDDATFVSNGSRVSAGLSGALVCGESGYVVGNGYVRHVRDMLRARGASERPSFESLWNHATGSDRRIAHRAVFELSALDGVREFIQVQEEEVAREGRALSLLWRDALPPSLAGLGSGVHAIRHRSFEKLRLAIRDLPSDWLLSHLEEPLVHSSRSRDREVARRAFDLLESLYVRTSSFDFSPAPHARRIWALSYLKSILKNEVR